MRSAWTPVAPGSDPAAAPHVDLVVAGAGVVGLGIALEAVRRGLSVVVVDADEQPCGASVRNFGHACLTAQTGIAAQYAAVARERWLELRQAAGVHVLECGTVVAARSSEELELLAEFAVDNAALLLDADGVRARVPVGDPRLVGGAFLPQDLRVDPRQAVPALAAHLQRLGVTFHLGTTALGFDTGVLRTSRGDIHADAVVLALGHDLDRLLPADVDAAGMVRCQLHMLRVAWQGAVSPALLTGTSLLRYSGFLACPSAAAVRARIEHENPVLLAAGVNLMLTQHPSGDLLIGDTHSYGGTPSPFAQEELDALVLDETRRLLGCGPLVVRERWLGTYASAPDREYLTVTPAPGVRGVAVTSGIGMTTALGLAPAVLDDLLAPAGV